MTNASIYDKKQGVGLTADSPGAFSVLVLPGSYNLTVSAVGYYARSRFLDVGWGTTRMDMTLNPDTRQLDEVNVKGRIPDANVSDAQMSIVRLDMKTCATFPSSLGRSIFSKH